jgi:hypothetical protein
VPCLKCTKKHLEIKEKIKLCVFLQNEGMLDKIASVTRLNLGRYHHECPLKMGVLQAQIPEVKFVGTGT